MTSHRPIILASASPQRKKLMKQLGIQFSVVPSRAKELKRITTTPAALVKANAVCKAQDVSRRHAQSIVIGADTIVYVGHKHLIGKPRNLAEAKRNLKILLSSPSWVYTGVAVIDARSRKQLVDYDKTKVFMLHLSEEEIDRYYTRMSPFDKAGGFDIEGVGAAFIHRIEGCYSNVIGLPMAKLGQMLKKLGVPIL